VVTVVFGGALDCFGKGESAVECMFEEAHDSLMEKM
jgi:hypothetical protein